MVTVCVGLIWEQSSILNPNNEFALSLLPLIRHDKTELLMHDENRQNEPQHLTVKL